jgi:hypothetical protein
MSEKLAMFSKKDTTAKNTRSYTRKNLNAKLNWHAFTKRVSYILPRSRIYRNEFIQKKKKKILPNIQRFAQFTQKTFENYLRLGQNYKNPNQTVLIMYVLPLNPSNQPTAFHRSTAKIPEKALLCSQFDDLFRFDDRIVLTNFLFAQRFVIESALVHVRITMRRTEQTAASTFEA